MVRSDAGKVNWGIKEWIAIGSILITLVGHTFAAWRWAAGIEKSQAITDTNVKGLSDDIGDLKAQIAKLWDRRTGRDTGGAGG